MLIDHIAIEAGFSKHASQAQCVIMGIGDEVCKFVHVTRQLPWFVAAVGGPMLKKGHMPTVHVVDVLTTKVHGNKYKDASHEDGDRSRGEDEENEEVLKDEENAEIDPMDMLIACAPDFETTKNKQEETRAATLITGACNRHAQKTGLRCRCFRSLQNCARVGQTQVQSIVD